MDVRRLMHPQNAAFGGVVLLVGASLFWLNLQVPRFADDFCSYAPSFHLSAIFAVVGQTWLSWTGRFPVIFIVHSIFSTGRAGLILFDILNAACLTAVCVRGVACAAGPVRAARMPALVFVAFLLWFTPTLFGEVALWKSGAVQYLWACALTLYVLGRVIDRVVWHGAAFSTPGATGFIALAFLGGAWLENLSVGVAAAWLLLLVIDYRRRHRIDRIPALGLVAWCLGALVLIAAPGNYARADHIGYTSHLMERITATAGHLIGDLDKRVAVTYVFFCLILLLTEHPDLRRKLAMSLTFAFAGAASVMAMAGAPQIAFVTRAAFPYQFFTILATVSLFPDHLFRRDAPLRWRQLIVACSVILAIALAADYSVVLRAWRGIHRQVAARQAIIQHAKARHEEANIALPALAFSDRHTTANGSVNYGRYFARDITPDPRFWRNTCYAAAHGVTSVILAKRAPR